MKWPRFQVRWNNPLRLRTKLKFKTPRWTWRQIGRALGMTAGAFLVLTGFLFAWYAKDLPSPGKIQRRKPVEATQILDRDGNALFAVFGEEKRISIPADQIPETVKEATIAIEDKNFFHHHGLDFRGIARASLNNAKRLVGLRTGSIQGGSTITQQYVKNALLSSERTIDRKIKELILAIELEFLFNKDQILALYLNEIPYGSNAYGIEAAAQTFFGKPAAELTLAESATLAALPQRPTYLSPYGNHVDELVARKDFALAVMADLNFISPGERDEAKQAELKFVPRREQILAPHFVFHVRDLLVEKYGEELVLEGGLKVTTTLNKKAQEAAEAAIDSIKKNLTKFEADNAALAAVDPKTGQILAMVGSVDYFDTEHQGNFNVATAARQPGSAFKPVVYATGFKEGFSPASTLWDVETDFGGGYTPGNFDGSVRGPVTIRSALANSLNIPAVKMLALAGLNDAVKTARDFGITTLNDPQRYGLALVLGGAEIKPLELAAAYGVFANGGIFNPTTAILKVEDNKGKVLEEWKPTPKEVIAPEIAYQISDILSDNAARTPVFGPRSPLFFGDRRVAAKTGTTQEFRDSWTAGYTPQVAAAVWVGNNDNRPMDRAGGVRAAGPVFHTFMEKYLAGFLPEDFVRPASLRDLTVDALSGQLPTEASPQTVTDLFAPWQVPTEKDTVHQIVRVNKLNQKLATEFTPPELVETKVFTRVHSERPIDSRWEDPVINYARSHGFDLASPPTEKDETTAAQLPTITITAPTTGTVVLGPMTIAAAVTAPLGVRSVDFSIDGIQIGSRTEAPFEIVYDASKLATGNHELVAQVTDQFGATASASRLILIARDESPPGPVSNPTASSAGVGTGAIRLTWINPSDADLAKVFIYRSTVSGQLGALVQSVETVSPGAFSSLNLSGQSIGTTYFFTLRPVDSQGLENQSTTQVSALAL